MVAPWIIEDTGGSASSSPYKFLTYNNTKGYVAATAGAHEALAASTARNWSSRAAACVEFERPCLCAAIAGQRRGHGGKRQTLTIGDGIDPAGLILNSKASISGGTLAFGRQ